MRGKPKESVSIGPKSGPLIDQKPLPILEVQEATYKIISANAAFCRLVNIDLSRLLETTLGELAPHGMQLAEELDRSKALQGDESPLDVDNAPQRSSWVSARWPLPDQSLPQKVIVHLSKAAPHPETLTRINEALLISGLREHELRAATEKSNLQLEEEISKRKATELLLQETNARLRAASSASEQANRAKDLFIAALSHELRTPLAPVLIATSILIEDKSLSPAVLSELRMIERNITLEARLVDDLLDVTKLIHGKMGLRPCASDAHALIRHALEMVRGQAAEKGVTIECSFGAAHGGLFVDPARFQQVIWNLLRNAVKFTPTGGLVTIRTTDDLEGPASGWLRVEVIDTGIGIDPAAAEKIFEPFDQGALAGDHRFGGVGLGLAIARSIVVLHGGTIKMQSAGPGLGATFEVTFPATPVPLSPGVPDPVASFAAPMLPPPGAPVGRSLRMLVVEDHPSTLAALRMLLKRKGYDVVCASTVAEALAAASSNSFDLVISDLGLPDGGGGIGLMKILREKYALRGVAVSGYGMEKDIRESREAGFVAHLIKPVSPNDLLRIIADLFGREAGVF